MLWYICFYSAAAVLAIALCAIVLMSVTVRNSLKSVRWSTSAETHICARRGTCAPPKTTLQSITTTSFPFSDCRTRICARTVDLRFLSENTKER